MATNDYYNQAYTVGYFNQYNNTISNGEARIPICFCIDTSLSMRFVTNRPEELVIDRTPKKTVDGVKNVTTIKGPKPGYQIHRRIEEVRRVLNYMLSRIRYNRQICDAVVVGIVTFDMFADCIVEFSEVGLISEETVFGIDTHEDKTNASKGIDMALERLDQFASMNRQAGNESYTPVLVFISDGKVTEDKNAERARKEVRMRSEEGKLNVIPIAIGSETDEAWLRGLSRDARVYHMTYDDEFDKVFDIITKKIVDTSMVISVDEGLGATTDDMPSGMPQGSSTKYGNDASLVEFKAFLDDFLNS